MAEPWDVKHDRANELLLDLRRSIRELKQSGNFSATTDETGMERAVRIVLPAGIPARLSAIVGDIVHNARSSLDTLALAVCEFGFGGSLSEKDEGKVQFPITSTPLKWEESLWRLPHARQEHVDFVRARQPWYWVSQATTTTEAEKSESVKHEDLSTLQMLSNVDKHRTVHLTAGYPDYIGAGADEGVTKGFRHNYPGRPWQDGDVVGWWVLNEDVPEGKGFWPQAELELSLQYHLNLNWPGLAVDQFLERLVNSARYTVVPLARMIGRG